LAGLAIAIICKRLNLTIPTDTLTLVLFGLIGVLNSVVPFTLVGWGQQTVHSAVAAILIATTPFSTLLLSHFMTGDDRFSVNRFIGVLIGFIGVVLLFRHELMLVNNSGLGMIAILLAAFCYSLSSLLIRRLAHLSSLVIVAGSLFSVCVLLLPILIWKFPPWQQTASVPSVVAILFLALGPTATAYVLRAQIVQHNGAVFMSNAGYLIPVFAALWSWLFLAEVPTTMMCVAMLLIFVGIYLGQRRSIGKINANVA